jgi:SAM-dependent methyltransferase
MDCIESRDADVREQDIYPHLKQWIWDNDITNVVDLGSGQGICSTKIPEDTFYTGVEPSPFLLKRAHDLYPSEKFLHGSAYNIPLASGSIEGIFSIAVWHLLGESEKAAHELSRVLREGGHFLIITADPNAEVWKKSHDQLYLRSETELTAVWARHNLKTTKLGAYRYFWFFEGRKVLP